jgi:hypothetical protein
LLNLYREHSSARLEVACRIANQEGLMRLKQVKSILQSRRDQLPTSAQIQLDLPQDHGNIRGPHHFH